MQSGDRLGRQVGEQRDFCLLPTFWELHRLTVDQLDGIFSVVATTN